MSMEVFQNTLNWNRNQFGDFYCVLFSSLNRPDYFGRHIVLFITIFNYLAHFKTFGMHKDGNNLNISCGVSEQDNFEKGCLKKSLLRCIVYIVVFEKQNVERLNCF